MKKTLFTLLCATYLFSPALSHAGEKPKELSRLQELMNTKVTSVSRAPENPFDAAAAIYVITREDIERSGATSIPEILRLAPGLQVAKSRSDTWSVSARGFNDTIANKLLVLIDGRSVYTPLFSGVYWDTQDTMIEDIKQIEIIRGPGASLWGANAVNGIINIITEETVNTLENIVSITGGTDERIASARSGGKISDKSHFRAFAKMTSRDASTGLSGNTNNDSWDMARGGFRVDWDKTSRDLITMQGDIYDGLVDRTAFPPILTPPYAGIVEDKGALQGGNVLARWTHSFKDGSSTAVQTYIDHMQRNFDLSKERRTTFDIDFQHSMAPKGAHEVTWGTGFRRMADRQPYRLYFTYTPEEREDNLFGAFVQDKITLTPEKLFLTLGTKLEQNDYTGFEVQPSARLAWKPTTNQTVWGSISRAVRTPSRAEDDISQVIGVLPPNTLAPGTPAGFIRWIGQEDFKSESLIAYELGYRIRPASNLSIDTSAFMFDYDDLRTTGAGIPFSLPDTALPVILDNRGKAESYGFEMTATWDATSYWQLSAAYSYITISTHVEQNSSTDILGLLALDEGRSPHNQFNIRSSLSLPYNVKVDNALYYADNLSTIGIPSYMRFDTRIAWQPVPHLEFSVVGQNLFDDYHQEFNAIPVLEPSEVGRSVYAKATLRF